MPTPNPTPVDTDEVYDPLEPHTLVIPDMAQLVAEIENMAPADREALTARLFDPETPAEA